MLEDVLCIILMNGVLHWDEISEVLPGALCAASEGGALPGGSP